MLARRLTTTLLGLAALLAAAAPASAAVTATQLTQPAADPTFATYDQAAGTTMVIAGTSNGGAAKLDLRCEGRTSQRLASNIVPNGSGGWSTNLPAASVARIAGTTCYLHAVPAGTTPTDRNAYRGVRLGVASVRTLKLAKGPNAGAAYDYRVSAPQLLGSGTYSSAGTCAVGASPLLAPGSFAAGGPSFACAGVLPATVVTRSAVRVDGSDAFTASAAAGLTPTSSSNPGFAPLSFTYSQDPTSGNVTIREIDTLVRCAPQPDAFPRSAATCSAFAPAGVRLDRTLSQSADGRITTLIDSWQSTDGQAHAVDVFYQQGVAGSPAFQFPWVGPVFSLYTSDFYVTPPAVAASFLGRTSATLADLLDPLAAISFQRAPQVIRFRDPRTVWLQYTPTAPPTGSATVALAYARATTQTDVAALAATAQAGLASLPCVVPRVIGLTRAQAKSALAKVNCRLGRVRHETSTTVRRSRVKSQSPRTGSTVANGYAVTVALSTGKPRHRHKARRRLAAAGRPTPSSRRAAA